MSQYQFINLTNVIILLIYKKINVEINLYHNFFIEIN